MAELSNLSLVPSSVATLLTQGDETFVRNAYLTLLGREADPSGLDNYLVLVRSGVDKAEIVATLARSDEGQQRTPTLPGLAGFLAEQSTPPAGWARRTARKLLRPWRETPSDTVTKHLRIVDNQLKRVEALLVSQGADLSALRGELAQLSITMGSPVAGGAVTNPPTVPTTLSPAVPLPRQAPTRVDQIYRGLRRMWIRRIGLPQ